MTRSPCDKCAAMPLSARSLRLVVAAGMVTAAGSRGDEVKPYAGPGCAAVVDDYFKNEVWAKVGAQSCLSCHKAGGDAEDSKFVLLDPSRTQGRARDEAVRHNRDAFARM